MPGVEALDPKHSTLRLAFRAPRKPRLLVSLGGVASKPNAGLGPYEGRRLGWTLYKLGQHLGVASDDLGECCGEGSNDPTRWSQEDRSTGVQGR
jgi:hypothetical protein